MRFTAVAAVVLISACMAVAQDPNQSQKLKDPIVRVRPTAVGSVHTTVAPTSVTSSSASSAAQLAKIEQQSARVRASKPVTHANTVAATPALDLGKNKPVRGARSPQPGIPGGH